MNENKVIKSLNDYLKGEYMGIHAYEHYIEQVADMDIQTELQHIQQEHKQHAIKIAERIQNLGGKAVEDNGVMLSMSETMMNLKGFPDTTEGILQGAIKGQEKGINKSEEIVRNKLDPESLQVVKDNLAEDRTHIDQLSNLLH